MRPLLVRYTSVSQALGFSGSNFSDPKKPKNIQEHQKQMIKMQQRLTETTKALEIARSEGAQRSGRTSDSGQSADMESISSTLVPQVDGGQLIFVEEIGEDAAPELSSACPTYRSIDVAHSEVDKAVSALVRDLRSLKQGLEQLPGALNGHHISPPAPF